MEFSSEENIQHCIVQAARSNGAAGERARCNAGRISQGVAMKDWATWGAANQLRDAGLSVQSLWPQHAGVELVTWWEGAAGVCLHGSVIRALVWRRLHWGWITGRVVSLKLLCYVLMLSICVNSSIWVASESLEYVAHISKCPFLNMFSMQLGPKC